MTHTRQPKRTTFAVANPLQAAAEIEQTIWAIQAMEHEVTVYIGLVREGGWSWERVGEALSMTRQGAQRKYGTTAEIELIKLRQAAEESEEAATQLARIERRLSVREVRERFEVRGPKGDLISQHYVQARAETAAAKIEGATWELVKLRDNLRTGVQRCRGCGHLHCACEDGGHASVRDRALASTVRGSSLAPNDEASF